MTLIANVLFFAMVYVVLIANSWFIHWFAFCSFSFFYHMFHTRFLFFFDLHIFGGYNWAQRFAKLIGYWHLQSLTGAGSFVRSIFYFKDYKVFVQNLKH